MFQVIRTDPVDDKTYNNTCVTSKELDQPVHPPKYGKASCLSLFDYPGSSRRHMRLAKTLIRLHRLIWVFSDCTSLL